MKRIALLIAGFFIVSISFGQNSSKRDRLTEAIASEMCIQMGSLTTHEFHRGQFTMQFVTVMTSTFDKHTQDIKELFGIDDLRDDSGRLLKQKVKI